MTDIGRLFEKLFAKIHNLKPIPGSGNGKFYKMDTAGKVFLYSLKATKAKSWRITKDDLDEVKEACLGPGGTGAIPALVTTLIQGDVPSPNDPVYVTLEFEDLKSIMTEDVKAFEASFEESKIINSQIPSLFKDKKKEAQDE